VFAGFWRYIDYADGPVDGAWLPVGVAANYGGGPVAAMTAAHPIRVAMGGGLRQWPIGRRANERRQCSSRDLDDENPVYLKTNPVIRYKLKAGEFPRLFCITDSVQTPLLVCFIRASAKAIRTKAGERRSGGNIRLLTKAYAIPRAG